MHFINLLSHDNLEKQLITDIFIYVLSGMDIIASNNCPAKSIERQDSMCLVRVQHNMTTLQKYILSINQGFLHPMPSRCA